MKLSWKKQGFQRQSQLGREKWICLHFKLLLACRLPRTCLVLVDKSGDEEILLLGKEIRKDIALRT